jgi:hypothetical protein
MYRLKILLVLLVIFQGCKKEHAAVTEITLNSMNVNHLDALNAVFLDDFGPCFPSNIFASNQGYVFQEKDSFNRIQESVMTNDANCDATSIPDISFQQYDLIGILTYGICTLTTEKQVLDDTSGKKYIYNIIVHTSQLPACKMLVSTMNWALVPKRPAGYTVQFNVVKVYM